MNRLLLFTFGLLVVLPTGTSALERPNIVWIVGENLCLDLGCYGGPNVKTPHLDSLAERGVRYTRVYSTSPVCAPSRSAFMVGMYQTTTDTHHMRSHRSDDFKLPDGHRPITHRLQDAGYTTANITKIGGDIVGTGKLDLNFVNEGPIYQTHDWSTLKNQQPFFAQINTPEVEYDIYDRKTYAKERVEWVGEEIHPQIATADNVTPPPYYPDHPLVKQEWARFLNSVSGIDLRVGRILKQLEDDGVADDTVVIFFGDNGRLEPRGIHWCWDSGLHVPLIICWPKNFPAPEGTAIGEANDRLISLLDITATTLEIAGVKPGAVLQSRSLLSDPQREYVFAARDRIDETVVRIRSVHGRQYHYLRNFTPEKGFPTLNRYKEKCFAIKPLMRELQQQGKLTGPALDLMSPHRPKEELYDIAADPHEIHNLADSTKPEHRRALLEMRAALATWMVETGDRGHIPEPPEIVAPFTKEMHDWFGTPEWVK